MTLVHILLVGDSNKFLLKKSVTEKLWTGLVILKVIGFPVTLRENWDG